MFSTIAQIGLAPDELDLFVEQVWSANEDGTVEQEVLDEGNDLPRGMWLDSGRIKTLATTESSPGQRAEYI